MRWVKETFPPRPRCRWLLMTILLSMSSLAGTARTLVAVGTLRLAAMFATVRAAAPRSLFISASAGGGVAAVCPVPVGTVVLASLAGALAAAWAAGIAGASVRTGCGPVPFALLRRGRESAKNDHQ